MRPAERWIFSFAIASCLDATALGAQDLTDVDEIVERANLAAYYAGDDGRA